MEIGKLLVAVSQRFGLLRSNENKTIFWFHNILTQPMFLYEYGLQIQQQVVRKNFSAIVITVVKQSELSGCFTIWTSKFNSEIGNFVSLYLALHEAAQ